MKRFNNSAAMQLPLEAPASGRFVVLPYGERFLVVSPIDHANVHHVVEDCFSRASAERLAARHSRLDSIQKGPP